MTELRKAKWGEENICYAVLDSGRKFQHEQGFDQWTQDYPVPETVTGDIESGKGFVVTVDGEIAGYMCIDFDGEPAYDSIDGSWSCDEPYAVIHRMAFSEKFRGQGLAYTAFELIGKYCVNKGVFCMRADTDYPNKRMQHIFTKAGFNYCGIVVYSTCGERMAYDKILKGE